MGWLVLESCEKGLQPCYPRLRQLWNFIWSSPMLSFGDSQPLLFGWLSNRRCPIILEGRECSVIFIANQLCWVLRRQVMHGHSAIVDGPWCLFFFSFFFTKMTSVAFWSAVVDGVGDEPRGLYCLLTIAARRFGRHRIGSQSIRDRSSFWSCTHVCCAIYIWKILVPTDGANWWYVNFHRQLHSQLELSTPVMKKTLFEDPAGVGPEGEAPMLKLAKNLDISKIERDFS